MQHEFTIEQRLHIIELFKTMNFKKFVQTLRRMSQDGELAKIIKAILHNINEKRAEHFASHIKGYWPFGKIHMGAKDKDGNLLTKEQIAELNGGVDPDFYNYSKSKDFEDDKKLLFGYLGISDYMMSKEFQDKFTALKESGRYSKEELDKLEIDEESGRFFVEVKNEREYVFDIMPEDEYAKLKNFMESKEFPDNRGHEDLDLDKFEINGKKFYKVDPMHSAYRAYIEVGLLSDSKDKTTDPEKEASEKEPEEKTKEQPEKEPADKEEPAVARRQKPTFNIKPVNDRHESWQGTSGMKNQEYQEITDKLLERAASKEFDLSDINGKITVFASMVMNEEGKAISRGNTEPKIVKYGERNIPCYIVRLAEGVNILVPTNQMYMHKTNNNGLPRFTMTWPLKSAFYLGCDNMGNPVMTQNKNGEPVQAKLSPAYLLKQKYLHFSSYDIALPDPNPEFVINGNKYHLIEAGGYTVYYNNKEALVSGVNQDLIPKDMGDVVLKIPAQVETPLGVVPTTAILPNAFESVNVQYVEIPDTIKAIGDKAFFGSGLKEISLPDIALGDAICDNCVRLEKAVFNGKELPDKTFHHTALKEFDASNIEIFGNECLKDTQLDKINMDNAIFVGTEALANNNNLIQASLDSTKINENGVNFDTSAFSGTPLIDPNTEYKVEWKNLTPEMQENLEHNRKEAMNSEIGQEMAKEFEKSLDKMEKSFQGADPKIEENKAPEKEQTKQQEQKKNINRGSDIDL